MKGGDTGRHAGQGRACQGQMSPAGEGGIYRQACGSGQAMSGAEEPEPAGANKSVGGEAGRQVGGSCQVRSGRQAAGQARTGEVHLLARVDCQSRGLEEVT